MDKNTGRFIAINLTEAEWQALRTVAPDPVGWIKAQIQRLFAETGVTAHLEPSDAGHESQRSLQLTD